MPNRFVTHLESAIDGSKHDAAMPQSLHAGRPLWVRYDLEAVRRAVSRSEWSARPPSLWRYRELLPLPFDVPPTTLGEGMSPLIECPNLARRLGLDRLWMKDESQLPTGSFKSRGMTVAVSMARWFGLRRLAIPTAGNAGGALAAYAARAGIETFVFMPADTPVVNQVEAALAGAVVALVDGLIDECGAIVRRHAEAMRWFDMSTLKEPYRLEGKKTMGLELAEQFDWNLPDVVLYPTGGGAGLIGMHKAFDELARLGFLACDRFPRLIACQSDGCAPIVRAFEAGERFASRFLGARTVASGLRVPAAVGDFMILDAVRNTSGCAVAGREDRIVDWMRRAASTEGVSLCPEAAVCLDCLQTLLADGRIQRTERVVVFNTGASQKYAEAVSLDLPRVSPGAELAELLSAIR